ncbi:glycoside hydrolase family 97 protein [Hymenobacter jejuensis]|uniref:Glycoside hydrolase family 97 protein n=1 Tax=Hymenobacter jejuensis TaxID=2502781 RepID=A0A5B8A2T7_9BACT|nr:glycoside hydrolase family 97 protein [Hymenobacter jejuensis]QDA61628.1 glycoside hydrolase family 97 protein [Hymenobacter jejuensis]
MKAIPIYFWLNVLLLLNGGGLRAAPRTDTKLLLSPNKQLGVSVLVAQGEATYTVSLGGNRILLPSKLGLVREDADFSKGLKLVATDKARRVKESYSLPGGKRTNCVYEASEQVNHLQNAAGEAFNIIFRVSNDGVAFRYEFPTTSADVKRITEEATSFHFDTNTRTWLQPKAEAQSGWKNTNPSYEMHYLPDQPAGQPSPTRNGWVYPALFRTHDTWVLLTEANLGRTYCGTDLRADSPNNEYRVGFPQAAEVFPGGALNPESTLPWRTPWRIFTIGSLKTIVESTLGTDLAAPAAIALGSYMQPGKAAWSWALGTDDATNYDTQHQFIDYAADMGWPYVLIDADWDTRIGYDKMQALADYAKGKNVGLLLWYNSSGNWNQTAYHPKSQLLTHADRVKEFGRLQKMGIRGIKIDFFGGDGQSFITYYQDILRDAADAQLLVNFHGATLPRGWQRTYPNLMTTEAVQGFEAVYNKQREADLEARMCTMAPFARNVFDPMDYTPVSLKPFEKPNVARKTTNGFELALAVVFLSRIQHYAEEPKGMAQQPDYVRDVMRQVPAVWDEVRFLDGFPGKYYVVARRTGSTWYVAGINAEAEPKTVQLDLSFMGTKTPLDLIGDGPDQYSFSRQHLATGQKVAVTMQPSGGFVLRPAKMR